MALITESKYIPESKLNNVTPSTPTHKSLRIKNPRHLFFIPHETFIHETKVTVLSSCLLLSQNLQIHINRQMPKLYYTTTSCGASSFIAAKAAGLKFEAEQVNLATHRTVVGDVDFYTINPKGNVPCLVLDDGTVINENIASLSFIGDKVRCELN